MASTMAWWQRELSRRPWWMNLVFAWCLVLAIGVPIEVALRPLAEDVEVVLGIELYGWAAKATGGLHAALFMAGAWGFWKMAAWMWPWAAVYVFQVALAHAPRHRILPTYRFMDHHEKEQRICRQSDA